jgi:hypothetical protein
VSLLPLLKARDTTLLGTDVGLDVTPSGVEEVVIPTHTVAIVGMAPMATANPFRIVTKLSDGSYRVQKVNLYKERGRERYLTQGEA